jgi:hypothetical protein
MTEMITRDRNHPSVVFWGILNENRFSNAVISEDMLGFVRSLDPTRVVIDNSGGTLAIDQDFGWVDSTRVLPDRSTTPVSVRDLHLYIGGILPNGVYDWLRNVRKGINSLPLFESGMGFKPLVEKFDEDMAEYDGKVFVSELGCGGFTDLDKTVEGFGDKKDLVDAQELEKLRSDLHEGFEKRRLDRVFGSIPNLVKVCIRQQVLANRSQIEALYQNPDISGYSLTQLDDVAWEFHGGILDLWRNPKVTYYELARLNKDTVAILHPRKFTLAEGETADIEACAIHRSDPVDDVDICISIVDSQGQTISRNCQKVRLEPGINRFPGEKSGFAGKTGLFYVQMSVCRKDDVLAETETEILVLPKYELQASTVIEWIGEQPEFPDTARAPTNHEASVLIAAFPQYLPVDKLRETLAMVEEGKTLILGSLAPANQEIIDLFREKGIDLRYKFAIGNWMGCHHWFPQGLVNEPLVTNPVADEKFLGITPRYAMLENGGEVFAGSFQNARSSKEPVGMLWYSDIEKVTLGRGAVVFCQYDIFRTIKEHPFSARMLDGILAWIKG